MTELNQPLLDGPIAGQSLTSELGGRPWQNAPQCNTVDEAIEYYLDRMATEEFTDQLVDVLEMGVPVTNLANTIQMGSGMDGIHNIDVGMLVIPILVELMSNMAEANQVPFKSGMEREDQGISPATIALARKKGRLKTMQQQDDTPPPAQPEQTAQPTEQAPMGLMARREQ